MDVIFVRLLFLKLKKKKNMKKYFFNGFYFKTQKSPFLEVKTIFFNNFFSVLAFKTIHTQMLFWSVFLKMHKKTVINRQKRPKWCFWQSITFLCAFSKILTKRAFVRLLFLKLNQSQNIMKTFFWGVFHQKPKTRFFGGPKW